MSYYNILWGALMLTALHFGLIAAFTQSLKRAWLFGCLAVLVYLIGLAIIAPVFEDIRGLLFAIGGGAELVVIARYKVGKKFDRKDFRIGRFWYWTPFVLEFVAAAVLIGLYVNSYLAAERFFDRLEHELAEFRNSPAQKTTLTLRAPQGSILFYGLPDSSVDEPMEKASQEISDLRISDLPLPVLLHLARIPVANDAECFVLIDPVYGVFVRTKAWSLGHLGGISRVFRWDEAAGAIRPSFAKYDNGVFIWEGYDDIRSP